MTICKTCKNTGHIGKISQAPGWGVVSLAISHCPDCDTGSRVGHGSPVEFEKRRSGPYQLAEQARAWEEVFAACLGAGMITSDAGSGLQDVLDFIKVLGGGRGTSNRAISDYVKVEKIKEILAE